jgi:acetoacetyl-CoA synthetase
MSRIKKLWELPAEQKKQTNLAHFMRWLSEHKQLAFNDYDSLLKWSNTPPSVPKAFGMSASSIFWAYLAEYFEIKFHSKPHTILSNDPMPKAKWFEGATLNYAERLFQAYNPKQTAIKFYNENQVLTEYSWQDLAEQTAAVAAFLRQQGVQKGDRVVGYLPNVPEAVIAFLAAASIGAVWSSCSPDFGTHSVVERFQQIEPTVLFTTDGYSYNGKLFDRRDISNEIVAALPTLKAVVNVSNIYENVVFTNEKTPFLWKNVKNTEGGVFELKIKNEELKTAFEQTPRSGNFKSFPNVGEKSGKHMGLPLRFESVAFDHPLYILYSSGTTGIPKAIVHGHGGITLEHLKYLTFHSDVRAGETFFWFTTTGWMMWNFSVSALMTGATLLIYDGAPTFPNFNILWDLAQKLPIHHFGTSAPYLVACMKRDLKFKKNELPHLRSISSTGSPLPPEAFDFVYKNIKKDVWLASMSGGTDVCTAWVGGNPLVPVYKGTIQSRCLGCAMESWDDLGKPIVGEVGEMVVTQPMPSMPIYFWNDPQFEKYTSSYFEVFKDVWRHGDWLKIHKNGSLEILGRSDATLNRQGIRIGTAEIYRVLEGISAVKDSLIVNLELKGGHHFMPLFVVLNEGQTLTDDLKHSINHALKMEYSPRHVPDAIVEVRDIPYTISGKKLEAPVKKILMGIPLSKAANLGSMRNPESLDFFVNYAKQFDNQRITM